MCLIMLQSTYPFQVTEDAQCPDSEHVDTSSENHICIEIQLQLNIAIAIL